MIPHLSATPAAARSQRHNLVAGAFIVFLAIYALSGPGRIDILDGQYRFDVSRSLVEIGSPVVRDSFLSARRGLDRARYSSYSPAASVVALPLVWVGLTFGGHDGELARFLFSFTSAGFAAATLALLLNWWLRLGVPARKALAWTAVVGLATLLWPQATSTFDQAQHAFFVLAAAYAGTCASEGRRSTIWALLSGLLAGILVLYQPPYLVLALPLALSLLGTTRPIRLRPALPRLALFAAPFALCAGAACLYNVARFGSATDTGAWPGHPVWGNALFGIPGLLVSPGKGVLWYSPVIVLQLWALRALWRGKPVIALTVIAMVYVHFAFISSLSFYGGDWAWGPRYLVTTTPLLALGLPFLQLGGARRWIARTLVGVGLLVQVAGLTMDHQGFFFAHALPAWFWLDPTANFRQSQLAYRAVELLDLFAGVKPNSVVPFRPGPYPTQHTYYILSTYPPFSPVWMRSFPVFYLPRPWPLWMPHLPAGQRPVPPVPAAALLTLMGAAGVLLIRRSLPSLAGPSPSRNDTVAA